MGFFCRAESSGHCSRVGDQIKSPNWTPGDLAICFPDLRSLFDQIADGVFFPEPLSLLEILSVFFQNLSGAAWHLSAS